MGIFGDHAQLYWDAGLQAIPLYTNTKRPRHARWTKWAKETISDEDKAEWLASYDDSNIGLVLGEKSGIVMIDIDTDDKKVIGILQELLPEAKWVRYGKKGFQLAYKFNGEKSFSVRKSQKETLVELLSNGRQAVLPPSIHPDTGLPYTSVTDLYDPAIMASLKYLPPGIEGIIRQELQGVGKIQLSLSGWTRTVEWVSAGGRDTKMIQCAGMYSRAVLKGEINFSQAINDMYGWEQTQVENVAGDELDISKGIATMARFLVNDVINKNRSLPKDWDLGLSDAEKKDLGLDSFDVIHTPWDFNRVKNYVKDEFMIHDVGSEGRRQTISFVLARMANASLSVLDEDRLLGYIAAVSQLGDKVSTLRNELKRLRSSGITGEDQTQIAKAMIEDLQAEGALRHSGSDFWQWQGSHWEKLPRANVAKIIADKYGKLPMAKRHSDHNGIMNIMVSQLDRELRETSHIGVNFANGYLDAEMVLRPHEPMYGCTYTLPYRYMTQPWVSVEEERRVLSVEFPDGKGDPAQHGVFLKNVPELLPSGAPKFLKFMTSCWGTDVDFIAKCRGLQEAIAVTLYGHAVSMQRAFCLIGPPKSGKSQLLTIIENLVPDEARTAVKPEDWGDKFLPAGLFGKLINICGELSDRKKIDGSKFKEIISGELQTVQNKHQAPFKFRPYCGHWFASNHAPRTEDTSEGFNRRWLLFTYNAIVTDTDKVIDIGRIIAAEEREVIASWAVQTFPAVLRKKDFTTSESHEERILEIAKSNNSLLHFLKDGKVIMVESILVSSPTRIPEAALYNAYFTFAIQAGIAKVVQLPSFRQKMRELGQLYGFRTVIETTAHGSQECFYESLTFVKNSTGRTK